MKRLRKPKTQVRPALSPLSPSDRWRRVLTTAPLLRRHAENIDPAAPDDAYQHLLLFAYREAPYAEPGDPAWRAHLAAHLPTRLPPRYRPYSRACDLPPTDAPPSAETALDAHTAARMARTCTPFEGDVLARFYGLDDRPPETLVDIGRALGVDHGGARATLFEALNHLREELGVIPIRPPPAATNAEKRGQRVLTHDQREMLADLYGYERDPVSLLDYCAAHGVTRDAARDARTEALRIVALTTGNPTTSRDDVLRVLAATVNPCPPHDADWEAIVGAWLKERRGLWALGRGFIAADVPVLIYGAAPDACLKRVRAIKAAMDALGFVLRYEGSAGRKVYRRRRSC